MMIKAEKAAQGFTEYAVRVYYMKNSGGGAHGMESETGRWHGESANDAAPPRSEVLTRPLAGLRSSPLPPLVWGG
jgi:hypothetical protein